MAADGTVKILIQADGDEAISSVDDLVTRLDGLGKAGGKTGGILKSVLGANLISNAVTSGISMLKDGIVGLAGDLSSASATWQTFNANMKNIGMPDAEIKSTTKQLQKFAQQTIYSSADMATTFSQLKAVGTKNTTQLITGFGGLAAAAEDPAQAMKTLSQQATQMAAKPKVQWEDFKLMLEQTPAGIAAVAKTMGKSTSQLITDIQGGKVTTTQFFDAINKAGNAPGFQKMATQYKTVGQVVDGLKETLTNKLLGAFNKVNSAAITAVSALVDAVGNMDFTGIANATVAALDKVASAIKFVVAHADELKAAAVAVGVFLIAFKAATFIATFSEKVKTAKTITEGFMKVIGTGPWGILIAAIAAVVVGLTYFFTKTKTGQELWAKFVGWIKQATPAFTSAANSIKQFVSSGLDKISPIFSAITKTVGGLISSGLSKIGPLMNTMGGAFGKLGALIGPVISVLTKVGLAALGITGPWGMVIGVIASFLGMWAKTGSLDASGITQVFDGLSTTITNVATTISQYLPQFIAIGTELLVNLINGITAALPGIISAATSIITSLTTAFVAVLPMLITVGVQILTTLIQGIITVLPTLITAALQIVTSLFNALITLLPTIISAGIQILNALVNGVVTALPSIISAAVQIITSLFNALVGALPKIISAGVKLLTALVNGLVSMLPALINAAVKIVISLVNALIKNMPKIISAGVKLLTALVQGLIKTIPVLLSGALKIIVALVGALVKNAPKLLSAGVKLIEALIKGLLQLLGKVGSAAVKLGAKVVSSVKDKAKSMASAGVDFVKGFIGGIGSMVGKVVKSAENLGKKAVGAVKKFLHIGSPSKVMRRIGVWTGEGFTNGIKQMLPRVSAMSERMANAAMFSTPSVSLGGVSGSIPRYTSAEQLFRTSGSRSVPSMQTINNFTNGDNTGGTTTIVVRANLDGKELAGNLVEPITIKQKQISRINNRRNGVR